MTMYNCYVYTRLDEGDLKMDIQEKIDLKDLLIKQYLSCQIKQSMILMENYLKVRNKS